MPNLAARGALHGLRVLDLTEHVAGPYCTRLLAGLGADVVKVERPDGGDPARAVGPYSSGVRHPEQGALFLFLNQGKQSVVLDLDDAPGRARFEQLLRQADILVESFPPRFAARLGLSYATLHPLNPALIVTSISSFGGDGPYRDFHATELVAAALGGLLHLTGDPGREPLQPVGWQPSYLAGATAAVGTLLALQHRRRTGLGQQVDVSVMESLASALEGALAACAAGEPPRRRHTSRRLDGHLQLLLPCRDGHVLLALASEADWEAFGHCVGDLRLHGPEFATPAARQENAGALESLLVAWLRDMTRTELFALAQRWRFPCCAVLAPHELSADPQHRARRFFAFLDHPVAGRLRYPGPPFRMPKSPWRTGRAPLLNEHAEAVFDRWRPGGRPAASGGILALPFASSPPAALAGLRVLDLTSMWAGPYCTRLLADAGAEVIKVELATRPDGTRRPAGALRPSNRPAPFFEELNRNKYGVTLDLRRESDRAHFHALVRTSDVLVENFSARVMPNLGLDYPALRALRPDLIMLSMPAFGGTGPYRHAVAFGSGLEAMSGLAALTGYPGGPPALLGVAYGDPVAGLHGAVAVLAALDHRRRTGQGQRVELAQREALTQFLGEVVVGHSMGAPVPQRHGNRHPSMAPHGCYRCLGEEAWVAIAVADEPQWSRLCVALGEPDLAGDPRFADLAGRLAHREALDALVEGWTRRRTPAEAASRLQVAGVPAGPVLDPGALLADRHLAARRFFASLSRPGDRPIVYPGPLCRLSASALGVRLPAPLLGEHNLSILGAPGQPATAGDSAGRAAE